VATAHDKREKQKLEEELVPLSVAGRVAYHHLVDKENRISVDPDLGRVLPLVAAALSAVAPIHRRSAARDAARTLTSLEVEAILFRPGCDALVALDELFIRRRDLHQAIESLRMARQYFGGKP
jgi:hypothetical protein